jgi:fumarate hydratase class II
MIQSIELLSDSIECFVKYCLKGLKADTKRISQLLNSSLMLVTALAPKIGYDNASMIAKKAHKNGTSLKEEALKSGLVNEKEYNRLINPRKMTHPN